MTVAMSTEQVRVLGELLDAHPAAYHVEVRGDVGVNLDMVVLKLHCADRRLPVIAVVTADGAVETDVVA